MTDTSHSVENAWRGGGAVIPAATRLRDSLAAGRVSAVECLDDHLRRIEAVNPTVNALVTVDVDGATARAVDLDQLHARGEPLGVLHGLPVAIKDTHSTANLRTTFGSRAFSDNVPTTDALIVQRLKDSGAIIVGKSNTPEFAAGSHTTNELFGPTRNPYDTSKSAGGSSGGAAAALATGMVALADGSDLGGSLRNPASFCNVVGLRPTPGRVPMWPAWDLWDTCAVQGPMARTVADIALALDAIAGATSRTPTSLPDESCWSERLADGIDAARVGVLANLGDVPVEDEVLGGLMRALEILNGLPGVRVAETAHDLQPAWDVFSVLRAAMFVARYDEIVADPSREVGANVVWNVDVGRRLSAADVAKAGMRRSALRAEFMALFDHYDYLVTYTSQVAPFDVDLPYPSTIGHAPVEDYLGWMTSCAAFSIFGVPILAVPVGFTPDGLPLGVQIIGRPEDEIGVLRLGHAFSTAAGVDE